MEKEKLTVKWLTRNPATVASIRERFSIPRYTTLNGLSPVTVEGEEEKELLRECERRGFLRIMPYDWVKNGVHFTFKYRK